MAAATGRGSPLREVVVASAGVGCGVRHPEAVAVLGAAGDYAALTRRVHEVVPGGDAVVAAKTGQGGRAHIAVGDGGAADGVAVRGVGAGVGALVPKGSDRGAAGTGLVSVVRRVTEYAYFCGVGRYQHAAHGSEVVPR